MQAAEDNEAYFRSLPPGYRFNPTDEELIENYLKKKNRNEELPINVMFEKNLYDYDPQALTEKHNSVATPDWYIFTQRTPKYPNGCRPNRGAGKGKGYWKPTGTDVAIPRENRQGYRKSLDYYSGKHPNGRKTKWKMHEFRLHDSSAANPSSTNGSDLDSKKKKLAEWVLCRIYTKRETGNTIYRNVEANPSHPGDTTADPQLEYQNSFLSQNGATVNGFMEANLSNSSDTTAYLLSEFGSSFLPPNEAGSSNPQQYDFHGSNSTTPHTTSNDMSNSYSYDRPVICQPLDNGWGHAGNNNMDLATMNEMTHTMTPNAMMPCSSTMMIKPEMENCVGLDGEGLPCSSNPLMFLSMPGVDSRLPTSENEDHCPEVEEVLESYFNYHVWEAEDTGKSTKDN